MAERGPVLPPEARPPTRVITTRPYQPPPPILPPDIPPPSEPFGSTSNRFASRPADRTLSVNAANGVCPIILGDEDLPVGGFLIYCRQFGTGASRLLLQDWFISEGELPTGAIANIKFGDKTATAVGATVEIHLGAAGDTTSTIMTAHEPTYEVPEGCAHVVVLHIWPNQTTGDFDPFGFTCTSRGIKATNLDTTTLEASGNPVQIVHELLINNRYSADYDPSTFFIDDEWLAGQVACDTDIGGGIKRWSIAGRIDQQGTMESWTRQLLDHCNGHMRHNAGKYGLWLDLARDRALDSDANQIVFRDFGDTANMYAKASVTHKGLDERPTVVTVDYTDGTAAYIDGSTQDPAPADVDPDVDWIEERFSRPFITTVERANRMTRYLKKLKEMAEEFVIPAWQVGVIPLEGDRVGLESRRVIPGDQTVPNVDAVEGVEEVIITDQTLSKLGVMLRARPYRDAVYDDTIDTTGGPNPPGGDGTSDPDPPTDLVLENIVQWVSGVAHVKVQVTWTPAPEPYSTLTRVTYSRDGGSTFVELGEYPFGPVFLENPELAVELIFRLYTVRISTGQISTAAEENIIPTYTDDSIPEITQYRFFGGGNKITFEGPRPTIGISPMNAVPPAPTVTLALAGFGGITDGDHAIATSRIYANGEGPMGERAFFTASAAGSQNEADVTAIDPSAPADVLMLKIYMTRAGDPNGILYYMFDLGIGSGINIQTPDSDLTDDKAQPVQYDGVEGWAVYDAFGSGSPLTDPLPLFDFLPWGQSPHRYKLLNCTPIVHPDGFGGFCIKVVVKVVKIGDGESDGIYFENLTATPSIDTTGNFVENRTTGTGEQPASGFSVSQTGHAKMFAINFDDLTIAANATYNDLNIPESGSVTIQITGTGVTTVTGIFNPSAANYGSEIDIEWVSSETLILSDNDSGSTAANRFQFPSGSITLTAPYQRVSLVYDYVASRWKLRSQNF